MMQGPRHSRRSMAKPGPWPAAANRGRCPIARFYTRKIILLGSTTQKNITQRGLYKLLYMGLIQGFLRGILGVKTLNPKPYNP